jgi:ribosomal protein L23
MDFTRIIIKPYHTEKSYALQNGLVPRYAFIVNKNATKNDIAMAFEMIYNHKPARVSTMIRKGANVRTGTLHPGVSSDFKIAYISLKDNKSLNISGEQDTSASSSSSSSSSIKSTKANLSGNVTKKEVKDDKTVVVAKDQTIVKKEINDNETVEVKKEDKE